MFEGIEVAKVVRDMAHRVPLVAEKAMVVRVCLGTQSNTPVTVGRVLSVQSNRPGATWIQVPTIQSVSINPAENRLLRLKREHNENGLNFRPPVAATVVGDVTASLSKIQIIAADENPSNCHRRQVATGFAEGSRPCLAHCQRMGHKGRRHAGASPDWREVE